MNNKSNIRGGSWLRDPEDARSAFRYWVHPLNRYFALGFRIAVHNIKKTTILRGGSWISLPGSARSAVRDGLLPDFRDDLLGFRIKQTS